MTESSCVELLQATDLLHLHTKQPHVVVVPYPLQGHLNAMLQLSELLAIDVALLVTVVHTRRNYDRINAAASHLGSSRVRHIWIPDGLPSDFDYSDLQDHLADFHGGVCGMSEPFRDLLVSFRQSRPATCVVYGSFCPWAHVVACKLGIPTAFFWTQSASVLNIYYHHPLLRSNGFFPYSQFASVTSSLSKTNLVDYIPGALPLHPHDIPSFLHANDASDRLLQFFQQQMKCADASQYVIINSFHDLESEACHALLAAMRRKSILLVGPLVPAAFLGNGDGGHGDDASVGASLVAEENECIKWLDKQASRSVLYISFGTIVQPSPEKLRAYAVGIQASRQPFLWVIRAKSSVKSISEMLPDNFEDETRGHGLIVLWAPQLHVLSHASIGAFLSHCGWNSTLESLTMGVPVISLPDFSDQRINGAYIMDVWKAGLRVDRGADGAVSSDDIEAVVKVILCGCEGEDLQSRAREWKEAARRATERGGSSHQDLQRFMESIKCAIGTEGGNSTDSPEVRGGVCEWHA